MTRYLFLCTENACQLLYWIYIIIIIIIIIHIDCTERKNLGSLCARSHLKRDLRLFLKFKRYPHWKFTLCRPFVMLEEILTVLSQFPVHMCGTCTSGCLLSDTYYNVHRWQHYLTYRIPYLDMTMNIKIIWTLITSVYVLVFILVLTGCQLVLNQFFLNVSIAENKFVTNYL